MPEAILKHLDNHKLAEGCLRNLQIECSRGSDPRNEYHARLLNYGPGGLFISVPAHQGCPVRIPAGEILCCKFRLGPETVRFTSPVVKHTKYNINPETEVTALLLSRPDKIEVIQRRRSYRVSMMDREEVPVTIWPVEFDANRKPHISGQYHGRIKDVSAGGINVLIKEVAFLEELEGRQLWVRFALPGGTESLIFRVDFRHEHYVEEIHLHAVGLQFVEFAKPGEQNHVIENLAKFVANRQRALLNRLKDR